MTVYKYVLKFNPLERIQMPEGAKLLSVQMQQGKICIWALVDPLRPAENVYVHIRGTGFCSKDIKNLDQQEFIGTVQFIDGTVWHVFKLIKYRLEDVEL